MKNSKHYLQISRDLISLRAEETNLTVNSAKIVDSSILQPFIKWAGGKRWLATAVTELTPKNWSGKYYEPFLGGGSFFFALAPKEATISDVNGELITTYRVIRDNHKKLIKLLKEYPYEKEFYYSIRSEEPKDKLQIAARFIYLNKSCWNGLYRVNSQGKFNTPFGKHGNPTICDEEKLKSVSKILKKAKIKRGCFSKTVLDAKPNDWIYFDPPYITGHQNNGFLAYNKKLFSWDDQVKLAKCAIDLANSGANVLVSNADYPKVTELYKGFYFYKTIRQSSIGLTKSRGLVSEAIISSYPLLGVKSTIIK